MKNLILSLSLATLSLFCGSCQKDVQPRPTANFTYSLLSSTPTQQEYLFTNTSINADRFQWQTSGGIANTDVSIKLVFTENGRKTVSLTAKNDVGEDTKTQNIDIAGIATTGQFLFFTTVGDKGDIAISVNNTQVGKINKYYSSGQPACGEQGSVTVTLSPGTYTYTAKSEGLITLNWSGTFTIERGVCKSLRLSR